jgi:hypothetical protein
MESILNQATLKFTPDPEFTQYNKTTSEGTVSFDELISEPKPLHPVMSSFELQNTELSYETTLVKQHFSIKQTGIVSAIRRGNLGLDFLVLRKSSQGKYHGIDFSYYDIGQKLSSRTDVIPEIDNFRNVLNLRGYVSNVNRLGMTWAKNLAVCQDVPVVRVGNVEYNIIPDKLQANCDLLRSRLSRQMPSFNSSQIAVRPFTMKPRQYVVAASSSDYAFFIYMLCYRPSVRKLITHKSSVNLSRSQAYTINVADLVRLQITSTDVRTRVTELFIKNQPGALSTIYDIVSSPHLVQIVPVAKVYDQSLYGIFLAIGCSPLPNNMVRKNFDQLISHVLDPHGLYAPQGDGDPFMTVEQILAMLDLQNEDVPQEFQYWSLVPGFYANQVWDVTQYDPSPADGDGLAVLSNRQFGLGLRVGNQLSFEFGDDGTIYDQVESLMLRNLYRIALRVLGVHYAMNTPGYRLAQLLQSYIKAIIPNMKKFCKDLIDFMLAAAVDPTIRALLVAKSMDQYITSGHESFSYDSIIAYPTVYEPMVHQSSVEHSYFPNVKKIISFAFQSHKMYLLANFNKYVGLGRPGFSDMIKFLHGLMKINNPIFGQELPPEVFSKDITTPMVMMQQDVHYPIDYRELWPDMNLLMPPITSGVPVVREPFLINNGEEFGYIPEFIDQMKAYGLNPGSRLYRTMGGHKIVPATPIVPVALEGQFSLADSSVYENVHLLKPGLLVYTNPAQFVQYEDITNEPVQVDGQYSIHPYFVGGINQQSGFYLLPQLNAFNLGVRIQQFVTPQPARFITAYVDDSELRLRQKIRELKMVLVYVETMRTLPLIYKEAPED